MKTLQNLSLFLLGLLLAFGGSSQQLPSHADFSRAEMFTRENIQKKVFNLEVHPQWFEDLSGFGYAAHTKNGEVYYVTDFKTMKKKEAFDRKRFSDSLHKVCGCNVSPDNLMLRINDWKNKNQFTFIFDGKRYSADLNNYQIISLKNSFRRFSENSSVSPDGQNEVFLKNDNLYLRNLRNDSVVPLSKDGSKYYIYGSYYGWGDVMTGEDAAPETHFTAEWSPDGKKILTQIMDARKGEKMYLLNWSIDSLYRPELLSYYRASPGDSNDLKYIPVIFDVQTGKMTKIDLPELPHYLGVNLNWTKDGKKLYGLYYHRGYKKLDFIEADPETGNIKTVFSDSSKTYIEYNTIFRYLDSRQISFISSEKSGWNQLYRLDWKTGNLSPLTHGDYVVRSITGIDTLKDVLYFIASDQDKNANPYYNYLYKINFDGSGLKLLTPEPIDHEVTLSPDKKFFMDNSSSPTMPTVSYLRSTENGKILMRTDSADIKDLLALGWHYPQIFTATARDGKTTIYGALWKPTNFNPQHKYPLIDYSYTGPQESVFPNTFSKALYSFYSSAQATAELGFIVMQVDGLGSAGRSKSFHDWSYKNLGNNLADHVSAIQQLGHAFKWIDTNRVGIYGHSAGGYDAAHALLAFNNCYKVAISESGDHDWRMEKAWWPEMYVGWPVDSNYQNQSNITMAHLLKGKLLLIHGGIDENVNPSATFKLSEALIKAGKYFDLLIIPSSHHGYPAAYQKYVTVKRWNFFVENLIINPPE